MHFTLASFSPLLKFCITTICTYVPTRTHTTEPLSLLLYNALYLTYGTIWVLHFHYSGRFLSSLKTRVVSSSCIPIIPGIEPVPKKPLNRVEFPKLRVTIRSSPAALQSPIEYQRKERSTAVMRSQPARAPQASPRPYSSVPMGSEKPPKGSSYNPPLPPLKISTSNGSPGFDYHQPGDKFEASKVSASPLLQALPLWGRGLRAHLRKWHFFVPIILAGIAHWMQPCLNWFFLPCKLSVLDQFPMAQALCVQGLLPSAETLYKY